MKESSPDLTGDERVPGSVSKAETLPSSRAAGPTEIDASRRWDTLRHNGVAFPPEYSQKGLSITVRGETLQLSPRQEEMVHAWVKKKDTPYVKDPAFAANFMKDLLPLLPERFSGISVEEMDFSQPFEFVEREKQVSEEEERLLSAQRKARRLEMKEKYGYVEIDGVRTEIANWMVEPPGLFIGRGNHPLRGRWKPRVYPSDITLNLDEEVPIPEGDWAEPAHDHSSVWIARWRDKLTGVMKYVWPSEGSSIRQENEKEKFDLALDLEKRIGRVRRYILGGMKSKEERKAKMATVCFLIDRLVMRVGDEKDEDEADTVGASTLRVEHVRLGDGRDSNKVSFDFLGKDSVRWEKSLTVSGEERVVLENLGRFTEKKKPDELLFDGISSSQVNRFLGKSTPGLTAKVFRTYHATTAVRGYLARLNGQAGTNNGKSDASEALRLFQAKMANLEAAITCNHKRTQPKNWEESIRKREEKLQRYRSQVPKSEKGAVRLRERVEKARLQLELARSTRDYNLNTSLKNYIDPRVYRAWGRQVGLDWMKVYPKSMQKRLGWVGSSRTRVPPAR